MARLTIRLREFRRLAGVSQTELARRARTSQTTVSAMERGAGRLVHLDILERLARALGVTASEMLSDAVAPKKRPQPTLK